MDQVPSSIRPGVHLHRAILDALNLTSTDVSLLTAPQLDTLKVARDLVGTCRSVPEAGSNRPCSCHRLVTTSARHPRMEWHALEPLPLNRGVTGTRRHCKTPCLTDCKSVAKASQVRILYLPPPDQRRFLAASISQSGRPVRSQYAVDRAAASKASATASRSSGKRSRRRD